MLTLRVLGRQSAVSCQFAKMYSLHRTESIGGVPKGLGKRIKFKNTVIIYKSKIDFDARVKREHQKQIGSSEVQGPANKIQTKTIPNEETIEVIEPPPKGPQSEVEDLFTPYRFVYPEFLPRPDLKYRNKLKEKLERMDMLKRRSQIDIPEFYVGSVLSVTVSDPNSPGKAITFVGICISRDNYGLIASFTIRNIVDGEGVEITYDMYNPTLQNITVLKLEKRLDESLRYLRDAPPEYSTFPFDMTPELRSPDAPVPINPLKIKLNPKPWSFKWHLWDAKGIDMDDIMSQLELWQLKKFETYKSQTNVEGKKYDLMKTYRETSPVEDQIEIFQEIQPQLSSMTQTLRKQKRKRAYVKPTKTA